MPLAFSVSETYRCDGCGVLDQVHLIRNQGIQAVHDAADNQVPGIARWEIRRYAHLDLAPPPIVPEAAGLARFDLAGRQGRRELYVVGCVAANANAFSIQAMRRPKATSSAWPSR